MNAPSSSSTNNSQILFFWSIVLAALVSFFLIYQSLFNILFNYWNEYGTYSHGYLTILLSAFLVYTCIKQFKFSYSEPSILSLLGLAIVSLIWLLAYFANVNTVQMLCAPFFIFLTLTYFCGLKNFRILLIPVFILLFTIPIWSLFLPYLQEVAVVVTNKLLSFSSLDYRVHENRVIFSQGIFQIEESCSGLRYLLVGVLLAVVYGFLNYQSYWSALVLILSTILIMLIGNILRILVIISLGVYKGMDYPLVQDHESLGWILFAFLLIPMFILARYINPVLGQKTKPNVHREFQYYKGSNSTGLILSLVLYLVTILVSPLYAKYVDHNVSGIASLSSGKALIFDDWEGPQQDSSQWLPNYSLYSESFSGKYSSLSHTVSLSTMLYSEKKPEGELINYGNHLINGDEWRLVESIYDHKVKTLIQEKIIFVNKATIESRRDKECIRVWYWFDVGGEILTKKWQVKLHETLMRLNRKSGSAITSISTSCANTSDEVLGNYLTDNMSQIKKLIIW